MPRRLCRSAGERDAALAKTTGVCYPETISAGPRGARLRQKGARRPAGEPRRGGSHMKKSNVVLIGMSGAGKSTVGVLLAKALGMGFTDTDIVIQQNEGRTLQSILDSDGADAFLRLEAQTVCALRAESCVIATGGSVVYSSAAMDALRANGRVVYLRAPFSELEKRLTNISTRGIVMRPGETLRGVFAEREPLYEKYCDLAVDCTGDIEHCVAAVIRAVTD